MIASMTAYGRAEQGGDLGQASCEIRSINHRYLEMFLRLPEELRGLEQPLRERISARLKRGKVDCTIRLELDDTAHDTIPVNQRLLKKLIETVAVTGMQLNNAAPIDPLELLRWPGVLDSNTTDPETAGQFVMQMVDETLDVLVATRQREGEKIRVMILERCDKASQIVANMQEKMPGIIEALREKYRRRSLELMVDLDHDRLEQEILLLTQKMDITEETDRLMAHIEEVTRVLDHTGPVGRRLDFLMQELNREANTLGSKSADLKTSNAAVDLKVLIEQMREQIQNIE